MKSQQFVLNGKATLIDDIPHVFNKTTKTIEADMETLYISIDPIMRVWLTGAKTYLPALNNGDTIHAFALSRQIGTNDIYFGSTGLQTHFTKTKDQFKIPRGVISNMNKNQVPIQYILPIILNGLPAYFGLIDLCKIKKGSNILISTAAGATGLFCLQLGLIYECNVYCLTSSELKKQFLLQNFPLVKVINYKEKGWQDKLPNIDSYFDNVGEDILDSVLLKMTNNGRIALVGSMGSSQDFNKRQGLKNLGQIIMKRIKIKGITFNQELNKFKEGFETILNYVLNQRIKIFIQEYNNFDDIPAQLLKLFKGENIGKILINLTKQHKL